MKGKRFQPALPPPALKTAGAAPVVVTTPSQALPTSKVPATAWRRGKLVAWDAERGFGFIEPAEAPAGVPKHFLTEGLCCHWSSFEGSAMPRRGAIVSYVDLIAENDDQPVSADEDVTEGMVISKWDASTQAFLSPTKSDGTRKPVRVSPPRTLQPAAPSTHSPVPVFTRMCIVPQEPLTAAHVRIVHELELSGEVVSWVGGTGVADGGGTIRLTEKGPLFGFRWMAAGATRPAEGTELVNDALAEALKCAADVQAKYHPMAAVRASPRPWPLDYLAQLTLRDMVSPYVHLHPPRFQVLMLHGDDVHTIGVRGIGEDTFVRGPTGVHFRALPITLPEYVSFAAADVVGDTSQMVIGAYAQLKVDVDELCLEVLGGDRTHGSKRIVVASDHLADASQHAEPAVWQVRLGGQFKPYEDSSVQKALEEALHHKGADACEVSVRGQKYRVKSLGGDEYQQVLLSDTTKTRDVRRVAPNTPPTSGAAGAKRQAAAAGQPPPKRAHETTADVTGTPLPMDIDLPSWQPPSGLARQVTDLAPSLIESICRRLDNCTQAWETSPLYDAATRKEVVEEEIRASTARHLVDAGLFDLGEQAVAHINASATWRDEFSLVRDDATHLRYLTGDHFQPHQDYSGLRSNVYTEYTLLVCVTPPGVSTVGGATKVYAAEPTLAAQLPGGGVHTFTCTSERGGALLFRKDAWHEGERVSAGEKYVVSFNLWGRPRQQRAADEVLLHVVFPREEPEVPSADGASADTLLHEANRRLYILSSADVDAGGESVLKTFLASRWADSAGRGGASTGAGVVRYECTSCAYDEFGIIYDILLGRPVGISSFRARLDLVRYFFAGLPARLCLDAHYAFGEEGASLLPAPVHRGPTVLPDLVVCESEARLASLVSYASERQLPFVPFRVIVCSGWRWGSIYMEDGYPERTYSDMEEHGSRHGIELQPVVTGCAPPALVDLSGRPIRHADWADLANAAGVTSRLSLEQMKQKIADRLVEAEKVRNVDEPSKDGQLVWLSLGSYDNILAVRRAGLKAHRERSGGGSGTPSLASWSPANLANDFEWDSRLQNEMGSLKVPTPSLRTLREEYNHWTSASPPVDGAAAEYPYTMQEGLRVAFMRPYQQYGNGDRWETDAAFEASARTWLGGLSVADSDIRVEHYQRKVYSYEEHTRKKTLVESLRVAVANLSTARLSAIFAACGVTTESVQDDPQDYILPASCGEMAGAHLRMPIGMEALDLLVSPRPSQSSAGHGPPGLNSGVSAAIDTLVVGSGRTRPLPLVALPGGAGVSEAGGSSKASALFHWDGDGKACFTRDEALRASAHVACMRLDERIRAAAGAMASSRLLTEASRWCNDENEYMEARLYEARGMVLLQQ